MAPPRTSKPKTIICYGLALFFLLGGIAHFVYADSFAAIVPPVLPAKLFLVLLTGVMELGFAALLLVPKFRPQLGIVMGLFLLAVLPANIYMAVAGIGFGGSGASPAVFWGRVALQFPLIALVLWATRAQAV